MPAKFKERRESHRITNAKQVELLLDALRWVKPAVLRRSPSIHPATATILSARALGAGTESGNRFGHQDGLRTKQCLIDFVEEFVALEDEFRLRPYVTTVDTTSSLQ